MQITIVEAHSNIFTAAAQKRDLHRGAEPGIEPGPAIQEADNIFEVLDQNQNNTKNSVHFCQFHGVWILISTGNTLWSITKQKLDIRGSEYVFGSGNVIS